MSSVASRAFVSDDAQAIYERLKPHAKEVLAAFNKGHFEEGCELGRCVYTILNSEQAVAADAPEQHLNDLYVLDRYADLILKYGELWQRITGEHFYNSWCALQDALDLLRIIKRFSQINIDFFEAQLTELERLYPYSVFASVGMLVERFDCSVCGLDIDSDLCCHVRGELYRGVMAYGIARNIVGLDHVALVNDPDDKRCVIQYDEAGEHFKLVRLLARLIASRTWRPSDFSHLQYSQKRVPNPKYRKLGRNDLCFCGKPKKFKACCINNSHTEQTHVDLVKVPRSIEAAVV
jgi:hypothetical protein